MIRKEPPGAIPKTITGEKYPLVLQRKKSTLHARSKSLIKEEASKLVCILSHIIKVINYFPDVIATGLMTAFKKPVCQKFKTLP